MGNQHRVMASGAAALDLLFGGSQQHKPPVSKEKTRFAWLPSPKLFCYNLWNGSIFKGLQEKLIISIRIVLLYYSY